MKDKLINYDDAIVAEINNKEFNLTINANTFSDEFYTVNYINSVFDSLKNCCEVCNIIINETNNYFQRITETENIKIPELINLELNLIGETEAIDKGIAPVEDNGDDENKEAKIEEDSSLSTKKEKVEPNSSPKKEKVEPNSSPKKENVSSTSTKKEYSSSSSSNEFVNNNKREQLLDAKISLKDTEYLNVYSSINSDNSSPIAFITNESKIKIIGTEDNMYKIIYGDSFDKIGYISKDFVEILSTNTVSTDIIDAKVLLNSNELLKIYKSSNLDSIANDFLKSDSNVKIIGEENNIYKIIYGDNFDKIGYVSKNYIK